MKKLISTFDRAILLVTTIVFVSALFLSVLSILFRWVHFGVVWIDPLVRHLVFLSIFLGATIAVERKSHIKVEFFHLKKSSIILDILGLLVLFGVSFSAYGLYQSERMYGSYQFLGIHSQFLVFILPLGFATLFFRMLLSVAEKLYCREK